MAEPTGTPLISPEDAANAENIENFALPRKAEQPDENKTTGTDTPPPKDTEKTPPGADAPGEEDDDNGQEDQLEEVVEGPPLAPDPGEFKPSDHSFQITVYNEKGERPKTVTVTSPEQFEELIEGEPNFGSASALLKAQRQAIRMEQLMEKEKADYDQAKERFEADKTNRAQQQKAVTKNLQELKYLTDQGDLPKVPKKYQSADWDDPEVAKDPGVKAQKDLFAFIKKENAARKKAGVDPITSMIDGFNAWERRQSKVKANDTKQQQGEARKAAGARVAGAQPSPMTTVPKDIMVGRTGLLR